MINGTSVGSLPHTRQEASPRNNTDARCACGVRADGYDARRDEPTCRICARTRGDGGVPDDVSNNPRRLREVAGDQEDEPSPDERQADALEQVAEELQYQNAVLTEVINTLDLIHGEGMRSATAINTAIDDHAVTRDRGESK